MSDTTMLGPIVFIVVTLLLGWFILISDRIPRALARTITKTNFPFYLDLMHTFSRRKTTRVVRGSRGARREASRQFARSLFMNRV